MGAGKILIVDDEVDALDNCHRILSRLGYECATEHDPLHAVERIRRERPELVFTDLRMPGLDGIGVLVEAKRVDPNINVVLLTAYATVQTAVESMRHGAMDYVLKPYTSKNLEDIAKRAFEQAGPEESVRSERLALDGPEAKRSGAIGRIVGQSRAIQNVKVLIGKVARTDADVLIYGESGTGKELVARAIHDESERAGKPFMPLDCVALPDTLLESELFGHEKGAFTGAHAAKLGLFEVAHCGTVFLDEVSGMSRTLQSRLLRVLQERHLTRLGGQQSIAVNVRIVAATNKDLRVAMAQREFREALYFRLSTFKLRVPPLRDYAEERGVTRIEGLIQHVARANAYGQLLLGLDIEAPDAEDLNAIFRAAHSLKGLAAMFGVESLFSGSLGEVVVAILLVGYASTIFVRSRRQVVDHTNVNEPWKSELDEPVATAVAA